MEVTTSLNFQFSHFCAHLTGAAAAKQRQQRAVLEDDGLRIAGGRRQTRHAEKHRRLRYAAASWRPSGTL